MNYFLIILHMNITSLHIALVMREVIVFRYFFQSILLEASLKNENKSIKDTLTLRS